MLFADDSAIVAHNAQDMQTLVDKFSKTAKQFSLKINISKTECMYQPVKLFSTPPPPTPITIDGEDLVQCKNFVYLGSTISDNASLESEITYRLGKASTAFGKLQHRLWNNTHVSARVKGKVYRAIVMSSLLYGAETWTIYRTQAKRLHAYMMRHLRQILRIKWEDKVTNIEVMKRTGLLSMTDILIEKNLRWLGHVHRMDEGRLPRQLMYSQLKKGNRNQGRPRLRFKDVAKRNMKARQIDTRRWKPLAQDREEWRRSISARPKP
jgi:hypothetical protein